MMPLGFECPDCGSTLAKGAKYCGCGWKRGQRRGQQEKRSSGGITACAWVSNGEQCQYPGTCSNDTHGMGPWYCAAHSMHPTMERGRAIVERSRTYEPRSLAERHQDAVTGTYTGPKACQEWRCLRTAITGAQFCPEHAKAPAGSLRLTRLYRPGRPELPRETHQLLRHLDIGPPPDNDTTP